MSTDTTTTSTAPDKDTVSIQPSDEADAFSVGTLAGHANLADYVANGLELTNIDWANGTFDLTEGKAFWLVDELADRPEERAWFQVLFTAHYTARQTVSFDASQPQYVFAVCNGVFISDPNDAPKIVVRDTDAPPREDAFVFATLDPASNSVIYRNQNPDGVFESVEAESVTITKELHAHGLIGTDDLADRSVTEPKLHTDAVSQRAAGPESIGSPERIPESVAEGDMADDAASTRVHADESVTRAILAAESVVTEKILDGTLTGPKYGDRSIPTRAYGLSSIGRAQLKSRSVGRSILDSHERFQMDGLTTTDPTDNRARHRPTGRLGASRGETRRVGGPSSDMVEVVQGGDGRYYQTWNADWDDDRDEWRYITGGEPAMAFGMSGGRLLFWTADRGGRGDPIDWETCHIDNGRISNAGAVGGHTASEFLRTQGVVDINGGEFVLLNDDANGRNTSHDLVFANRRSGDRIHQNYANGQLRIYPQGKQFSAPMAAFHRNGLFRPGTAITLPGFGGGPGRPRVIGANLWYNDNEVRVIKDNGDYAVLVGYGNDAAVNWR